MAGSYEQATLVSPKPFLELNNQGQILRFELQKDEHRLGRDRDWADLEVPLNWEVFSRKQAVFKKEGEDYRNF